MNPYEILGVHVNATDAEIKSAYRKLVKQFHPDVNKDQNDGRIRQLNEAYDILSDPVRKAVYDRGRTAFTFEYEEDPREVYRREYISRRREKDRKKREEENRKAEELEVIWKVLYKAIWLVTFPILVFALILVIDNYLPSIKYQEVADLGWQQRVGGSRRGSRGELISFMQTKSFVIVVPDYIHIDYEYFGTEKELLTIAVSPIFNVPKTVSVNQKGAHYTADIGRTIFSNPFKVHYLLLIASLFIFLRKDYSKLNFSLCFLPLLLLLLVLLYLFPHRAFANNFLLVDVAQGHCTTACRSNWHINSSV